MMQETDSTSIQTPYRRTAVSVLYANFHAATCNQCNIMVYFMCNSGARKDWVQIHSQSQYYYMEGYYESFGQQENNIKILYD